MSTQPQPNPAPAQAAPAAATAAAQAEPQPQPRTLSSVLDAVIANTSTARQEGWANMRAIATVAAGSGAIADLKNEAEGSMRLLAGRCLEINDYAALNEIKFIKGNVTMRYTLIGTLVRRAGYTWGYLQHDENGCTLAWFYLGKPFIDPHTGKQVTTSWNRKDAETADLTGPRKEGKDKGMYEKYPKSMYLAGALRAFPRHWAPEITNGITLYTPDEMGAEIDEAGKMVAGSEPDAAPTSQMPQRKVAETAGTSAATEAK